MTTKSLPPPTDDDPATQIYDVPGSNPESAPATVSDTGESKLKTIVGLLKRCLGVKDIAAMRLSLPASLLEPMPNLEYWGYLDRPDLFAAINDYDDPFYRMLAVVRFTFSKDIKFIRGKICKPYNSVLGEYFRAHWDIIPLEPAPSGDPGDPPIQHLYVSAPSEKKNAGTVKASDLVALKSAPSSSSRLSVFGWSVGGKASETGAVMASSAPNGIDSMKGVETLSIRSSMSSSGVRKKRSQHGRKERAKAIGENNLEGEMSSLSLTDSVSGGESFNVTEDADTELIEAGDVDGDVERMRVVYLTEQVSHHPPISSYYMACPAKHIVGSGVDQISAKVSGTTVRVAPGAKNKGIFLRINAGFGEGERYQITHPTAQVNGILRGSFYATVAESTIITMTGGKGDIKYRAVMEYKEESWLGKPQFAMEGVIYTYTASDDPSVLDSWTRVKHVPKERVVAVFEGSWKQRIRWRKPLESDWKTLLDLSTLHVVPKSIRPLAKQAPNESRKLWEHVTSNLLKKEYSEATRVKMAIEQRQRDIAAERKKKGVEFAPAFFDKDIESGESQLTPEGEAVIRSEMEEISESDDDESDSVQETRPEPPTPTQRK